MLGTIASVPYAGMAWMHMQFVVGLLRLGHDVYYLETTSAWPYDPERKACVDDSAYAAPYLARVAAGFGINERWAYRRSYADKAWLGPVAGRASELLAHADAVLNISGATRVAEEGLKVERLVYVGTDPGAHDLGFANGDAGVRALLGEHHDCVTYGENIGTPRSPIPALPRLRATTRQPVLLDMWDGQPSPRRVFTTVGNWRQADRDVVYQGETYFWSKHHEFLKFIELPHRCRERLELATGLVTLTPDDRRAPGVVGLEPRRCSRLHARSLVLSGLRGPLVGRVHGGQGPEHPTAQRLVQRAERLLPGGGASGDHPGHGLRGRLADG